MSLPRNNLDDMLRKSASLINTSAPSVNEQRAPASKSKFRAARAATPSTPVRSLTLPNPVHTTVITHTSSCLTPRIVRRTPASRNNPRSNSPIAVSSDESSPISSSHLAIPSKRASPHTAYNPPHKRPKPSPEKENLYQASLKGKAREHSIHTPIQLASASRHTPGTPVRPPASPQRALLPASRSVHPASDSQLKVPAALRLFQLEYLDLLHFSIEELQQLKKDVTDAYTKYLTALLDVSDFGRKILRQVIPVFEDLISCTDEVIKARNAGNEPTLPQSKRIASASPSAPLQTIETPTSPSSSSTRFLQPSTAVSRHLPALHIDHSSAVCSTTYRNDLTEDVDMGPNLGSDDVLWQNMEEEGYWQDMDELTQDELDFTSVPSFEPTHAPALLPPVVIATPPCSQVLRSARVNSTASSSTPSSSASTSAFPALHTLAPAPALPNRALLKTPFYPELHKLLRSKFNLPSFRPNQLEAISAYMEGKDVFVLMPTGGGKSLCFQLPAVLKNQQTNAVTFVVSPLKSLMVDQVAALQARGISVVAFHSDVDQRQGLFDQLMDSRPGHRPSLAYITPELLQRSGLLKDRMKRLAETNSIAGFVADEAHCISTWGRAFRESYAQLSSLREEFPGVPIMALTATADRQATQDIVHRLHIQDCEMISMSFNRPNLTYTVKDKGGGKGDKSTIADMATWIKEHHANETGIVYCSSRVKTERVAQQLRETYDMSAEHYHADIDPAKKRKVQNEWQAGKIKIIVATIAFGMGIDKPDVRFVVHLQLPLSLSNYYQETGRAGRDGLPADCRLYYAYQDAKFPMDRARQEAKTVDAAEAEIRDIRRVVEYCTNNVDCRRVLVLAFFEERFDAADCRGTCDNCMNPSPVVNQDLTDAAANMVRLAEELDGQATRTQVIEVFIDKHNRGTAKFADFDLPHRGCGKDVPRDLAERLFDHLLIEEVFGFVDKKNGQGWSNAYAIPMPIKANHFLGNRTKVVLRYKPPPPKRQRGKKGKDQTESQSTEDTQAGPSRPRRQLPQPIEVNDDPIEEFDDTMAQSFCAGEDEDITAIAEHDEALEIGRATSAARPGPYKATSDPALDDDSDIEILEDTDWGCRFQALIKHRKKLEKDLSDEIQDVYGDDVLQLISSVLPSDVQEFKQHLREFGVDMDSENIKYIPSFLQVIVPFKTAQARPPASSSKEKPKPPSMSQLHRQYDYQSASSSKPNSRR